MAKQASRRHAKHAAGGRTTPKGVRPTATPGPSPERAGTVAPLRQALRETHQHGRLPTGRPVAVRLPSGNR